MLCVDCVFDAGIIIEIMVGCNYKQTMFATSKYMLPYVPRQYPSWHTCYVAIFS